MIGNEESIVNDPSIPLPDRLEMAAKRDKGTEIEHEIKSLDEIVHQGSKIPSVKSDFDVLSSTREEQLVEKIASLQHLAKHYKSEIEKVGKHVDRLLALAVHSNDSAEKKRAYREVSVRMHKQGQMNDDLKHVKELLFDAKRAKEFMHEKRRIRNTLNKGELRILTSMAPMMKRMQERILGHIELVKSHLREEDKHFNETTKIFQAQVAPLKSPMQKGASVISAANKKIDQYKLVVKNLLSQRQSAEKSAEVAMKQCSDSSKHMIERKETLNDISDRMQETQVTAANKVAKMRLFWLRAVYRFKQATNTSNIDGPTPFEDTPDVIEKDTLKLGTPHQLKKALFSMYNEILLPQQAKIKEDVVPPNDVIQNVAKIDAMMSLEVDSGFDA